MNTNLRTIKIISRTALGLVWFYEGLVPKILFLRADEIGLVQASNLVWRTPQLTLQILGVAQMLVGLWLIIGFAERTAVFIATSWMLILIVLVASANPSMLTDPYGALVKDFCLIACAITVWGCWPERATNLTWIVLLSKVKGAKRPRAAAALIRERIQISARERAIGSKA